MATSQSQSPSSTTRIRLLEPEDAESLVGYLIRNREFHTQFVPTPVEGFFTVDFQRSSLVASRERRLMGLAYRFAVVSEEHPDMILGVVALSSVEYGAFRNGRISYMLDEAWIGRGVGYRSVGQLIDFAFSQLQLHRLEAHIMPRNLPSRRLIEKCDFTEIGTGRQMVKINGVWEDHVIYARINEENYEV